MRNCSYKCFPFLLAAHPVFPQRLSYCLPALYPQFIMLYILYKNFYTFMQLYFYISVLYNCQAPSQYKYKYKYATNLIKIRAFVSEIFSKWLSKIINFLCIANLSLNFTFSSHPPTRPPFRNSSNSWLLNNYSRLIKDSLNT